MGASSKPGPSHHLRMNWIELLYLKSKARWNQKFVFIFKCSLEIASLLLVALLGLTSSEFFNIKLLVENALQKYKCLECLLPFHESTNVNMSRGLFDDSGWKYIWKCKQVRDLDVTVTAKGAPTLANLDQAASYFRGFHHRLAMLL